MSDMKSTGTCQLQCVYYYIIMAIYIKLIDVHVLRIVSKSTRHNHAFYWFPKA